MAVATAGRLVSRGVPKRRAHVARRRELALMLRIVVSVVNERRAEQHFSYSVFSCASFASSAALLCFSAKAAA